MSTSFRTTGCARHGHREFTLLLAQAAVPGIETMLLSYLEGAVAGGSKFLPDQTVQLGWSTLRVIERGDGTLGLEERLDYETWVEGVAQSLRHTWLQKEVASSVGLAERMAFPRHEHGAMVSNCCLESAQVVMTRIAVEEPTFSGWSLTCADDHDHGDRRFVPLIEVTKRLPFAAQFLALPVGAAVLVMGPGRIRVAMFMDGEELKPAEGSYVAELNAAK